MRCKHIAAIAAVTATASGALVACQSTKSAPFAPPTSTQSLSPAVAAPESDSATVASAPSPVATLGESVTDGNYSFVVNKVQCAIGSLSSAYETGTPSQGQFCIIVVTETNITNVPQSTPPDPSFSDTTGNTYDTTSNVSAQVAAENVYLDSNFTAEYQVNPGSHYTDVFVYDVPRGVQAKTVTLHGDYGTTGTTVAAQ